MSLADELLADLEEDEEAEENQLSYEAEAGNQDESAMQKAASLGDHNPIPMDQGMLLILAGFRHGGGKKILEIIFKVYFKSISLILLL